MSSVLPDVVMSYLVSGSARRAAIMLFWARLAFALFDVPPAPVQMGR